MNQRQRIIFVLMIIGCILALFGIFWLSGFHKGGNSAITSGTASYVTITNASDYATWFSAEHIPSVESAVYQRIKQYAHPVASHYDAIIRQGSLHTTYDYSYNSEGAKVQVPTADFVVDIPAAKQTYSVSYSGGPGYPYSILYVLCPSRNQLIYGDFGCKDGSL